MDLVRLSGRRLATRTPVDDQINHRAIEHAVSARRDGDRRPLVIQGRVLLAETVRLLSDLAAGAAAEPNRGGPHGRVPCTP